MSAAGDPGGAVAPMTGTIEKVILAAKVGEAEGFAPKMGGCFSDLCKLDLCFVQL